MISLIFLGYSVNQNNRILQANNDNFLYELQDSHSADIVDNPAIIPIHTELFNDEELTQIEGETYAWHLFRFLDGWEMAFNRYRDGMLDQDTWENWDRSLGIEITVPPLGLPREIWDNPYTKDTYGPEFAQHVDAAYSLR